MGFKSSMITVNNLPADAYDDRTLLDKLGYTQYQYVTETSLEECIYPRDGSINIGYYNNNLIICEDYQCTGVWDNTRKFDRLAPYEQALATLFPQSEILTTACHSAVNYHLYTLVKNGERVRFKRITSDDALVEYGNRLEEEVRIYEKSTVIDGKRLFKSDYDGPDGAYEYQEDQLMEDFTFGVAKRHLGVMISSDEDEELMFSIAFKKYQAVKTGKAPAREAIATTPPAAAPAGGSWISRQLKKWGLG